VQQPPVVVTVAGFDPVGGAGVAADLRAFAAHGVHGAGVVTVLTAQDTVSVREVRPVPADFVAAQLDAVLADLPVAAAKTGMLGSAEVVALVAARQLPGLVVDPVLVSRTGRQLFGPEVVAAYRELLLPAAAVVTPNAREAALLTGRPVSTVDEAAAAAESLGARCAVITGGVLGGVDVVWHDGAVRLLKTRWIDTTNTRGSGCTFAAVVAARLAHGDAVADAVDAAKEHVTRALHASAAWRLGAGPGPLGPGGR
jgi:hydroxymethylpyrimidine/phosphomethylpyrimidine kinase